jgi:signal transduction histidine kinase
MSHDLLAELAGYRAELDYAETHDRPERAKSIRGEINRVTGAVKDAIAEAEAEAEEHDSNGQDVPAAHARVEVKRLRRALADSGSPETAADRKPRETAVVKKRTGIER